MILVALIWAGATCGWTATTGTDTECTGAGTVDMECEEVIVTGADEVGAV